MSEPLTDAILRHALELQRLSDHDAAQAEAILRELEGDLRRLMASRSLDTAGKREIEALIKEAEKAISGRYINIAGVVDTEGIVEHVAERTVNLIDQHYPFTPSMPSAQMLNALATDILIYGSPASEWWKEQDRDTAKKFARIVRQGVQEGRTNEQMVRQVAGGRDEPGIMRVARDNARALVHSSVMTAANRGRWETFKKNFGERGAGVEWLATLDSHTCPRCGALDGQKWDWEMNPIRGSKMDFHMPPLHWNCFPGDTLVASRSDITGVSKRWFDGEVVIIKTASGRELTSTPNHPILTDRGWVNAGVLDVGSNVVCDSRAEREGLIDGDSDDIPARIHDVAESFLGSGEVVPVPVEVAAEDFHGDGVGSDVAVVWSNSLLRHALDSSGAQPEGEPFLVGGSSAGLHTLTGECGLAEFVRSAHSPFTGGMGGGDLGAPLCRRHSSPPEGLGFGLASPLDASLTKNTRGDDPVDAVLLGDGVFGHASEVVGADSIAINDGSRPDLHTTLIEMAQRSAVGNPGLAADFSDIKAGEVKLDEIIDIRRTEFSGHVYNLETSTGWYLAQGVVVHNCRCILSPLPAGKLDEIFGATGLDEAVLNAGQRASSQGPVDASTTFRSFLKRQSPEFVEDVLGTKRADLYLAGKITLNDLVTKGGRERTLAELKAN